MDRFEIQKSSFHSELIPIQIPNLQIAIKLQQTPIPTPNSQVLHGLNNKQPYQHKSRKNPYPDLPELDKYEWTQKKTLDQRRVPEEWWRIGSVDRGMRSENSRWSVEMLLALVKP